MIDLRSLETIANAEGGDVVVTRRWLRRVLEELRAAREPRDWPPGPPVPSGPPSHFPIG